MKKKNYEAIASILNYSFNRIPPENATELGRFTTIVRKFTDYLKTTNPKFDQNRFIAAVYKKS